MASGYEQLTLLFWQVDVIRVHDKEGQSDSNSNFEFDRDPGHNLGDRMLGEGEDSGSGKCGVVTNKEGKEAMKFIVSSNIDGLGRSTSFIFGSNSGNEASDGLGMLAGSMSSKGKSVAQTDLGSFIGDRLDVEENGKHNIVSEKDSIGPIEVGVKAKKKVESHGKRVRQWKKAAK
ncbi:hypothetical protein Q3G72_023463 [Acer saccharum]|nr:hypothetical protein Q3G72_023463 [Acer saccharum]